MPVVKTPTLRNPLCMAFRALEAKELAMIRRIIFEAMAAEGLDSIRADWWAGKISTALVGEIDGDD